MKWEYKTVEIRGEHEWLDEELLNELGQSGWELIAIADTFITSFRGSPIYRGRAYFKRPLGYTDEVLQMSKLETVSE